jgi:ketosteroid isomerase-like protein
MNQKIERFIKDYNSISKDSLNLLEQMYDDDVLFVDPLHEIKGIKALKDYFANLYANVSYSEFKLEHFYSTEDRSFLYWTMRYQHRNLNKGRVISVTGHSHIQFVGDKVIYHRDYVDVGEMLYEHVPILGWAVKKIKARASS